MCLIVGPDPDSARARARARAESYLRWAGAGGLLTKWCGWAGVDLAAYPDDTPIGRIGAPQMLSAAGSARPRAHRRRPARARRGAAAPEPLRPADAVRHPGVGGGSD